MGIRQLTNEAEAKWRGAVGTGGGAGAAVVVEEVEGVGGRGESGTGVGAGGDPAIFAGEWEEGGVMPGFVIRAEYRHLPWSTKSPSAGEAGCTCTLCGEVIGVAEGDPRWEEECHEDCGGCPVCETPIRLFRERSAEFPHGAEQRFHAKCLEKVVWFPSPAEWSAGGL